MQNVCAPSRWKAPPFPSASSPDLPGRMELKLRKLMVCLTGAALVAAGAGPVFAQQAVTINGVQAMQVVIAPPDSPMAQIIKDKLNAAYYGASPSSKAYSDAQKLYYFYGARHFDPIWLKTAADGSVGFSPAAEKIIGVFKNAATEGFHPGDYLTPAIDITTAGSDPQKLAAIETSFSAATIHYAHDAYMGRIAPETVSNDIDPETKSLDAADTLMQLAQSDTFPLAQPLLQPAPGQPHRQG